MTLPQSLGDEKYLLLTTFRKDGRPVPTPVWAVRDGDALGVWSATDAGKVKRIRRRADVTVTACDARGRPRGEPVAGRATIVDLAGSDRVRQMIIEKYGIVGRLSIFGSRLRRGRTGTVGIRITLPGGADDGVAVVRRDAAG